MITSFIGMPGLPNFVHITRSKIKFELHDEILFSDVVDRNYNVLTYISKYFILRRPGVTAFANIIKVVTTFSKTIFRYPKKAKRIINYISKCNLYLYFLI